MELIELTCPMKNQKEFSMKLTVQRVQVQAFVWTGPFPVAILNLKANHFFDI